jgi:hypothetical protein
MSPGRVARPSIHFVPSIEAARATPEPDLALVLDSAWTPQPRDPGRFVSLRPAVADVVERRDLFEEALELVDRWAESSRAADLLLVEGVSYWFRMRESLWHWTHERLLWQFVIDRIALDPPDSPIDVPAAERALADVLRSRGRMVVVGDEGGPVAPGSAPGRPASRWVPASARQAFRRIRPRPEPPAAAAARRMSALLEERRERLLGRPGPKVIVVTLPSSYQRIGGPDAQRQDPNLGPVISALAKDGFEPIVIGWGMGRGRPEDEELVASDERLLPSWFMQSSWARAEDEARATAAVEAALEAARGMSTTHLELNGHEMTADFLSVLGAELGRVVRADVLELARVERLIQASQPVAIVMSQEGHRTGWLIAGARANVPTFAVQHGVLYRTHPGYPAGRHPAQVLATCTFVYGAFDRRVLLSGAYRESQVEVSGSPRLELDQVLEAGAADPPDSGPDPGAGEAERAAVRSELGVADGDRLLVVSSVNLPFVRRAHQVHMIERTLGGPLPRVHLVFKQHPGERDEGPYRELMAGLAAAGGYAAPPISVIRDVDLYRLLRASDAHLGLHSTVLTDAVAAGVSNLVALVDGHQDLLGYVPAGVARPVTRPADVLLALDSPAPIDLLARRAFLDDHFEPGSASRRIVTGIRARLG